MSLPQMAVASVLANPAITSPIVGASRPQQLAAIETPLEADLKARLDDLIVEYRRGNTGR
jgi:aryl-alcohol dehydrogenase-like predicted oxidoreductase